MATNWIYKKNHDNSVRFILGQEGRRPLVCFGVNPSTAEPDNLDRTLARVRNEAIEKKFDGWIMFNLYPQRATDPKNLHVQFDRSIHKINLRHMKNILSSYSNLTIWGAWGGLIEKRPYLKQCLLEILSAAPNCAQWVSMGKLVADKHPHHPLYLKKGLVFDRFDVANYIKKIS